MQVMEMWFALAFLSAFLLLVSCTNTHPLPHMHRAVVVCAVVQAVLSRIVRVRVCQAVVKWAQFGVLACVPSLHKNATQLLH